jgi:TRAP transporter TAXI family solute receptor
MTGGVNGSYFKIGDDIVRHLSDQAGSQLRILNTISRGSVQNVYDLVHLRLIDIAIVQSDVLKWFAARAPQSDYVQKIRFLAPLHTEEIHVLARSDIGTSIFDLRGRRVMIGPRDSGTSLTAELLLDEYINSYTPMNGSASEGLVGLKNGTVDAVFFVGGQPLDFIKTKVTAADNLTLLSIPLKQDLPDVYFHTSIQAESYPNSGFRNSLTETIGVKAVLAAYEFDARSSESRCRHNNLIVFTTELLKAFDRIKAEPTTVRHPKWNEINLLGDVPGWQPASARVEALRIAGLSKESVFFSAKQSKACSIVDWSY